MEKKKKKEGKKYIFEISYISFSSFCSSSIYSLFYFPTMIFAMCFRNEHVTNFTTFASCVSKMPRVCVPLSREIFILHFLEIKQVG